jgi:hypothetical protein
MSLSGSSTNEIKLEAVSVKFGREECRKVTFVDDVAGSVSGQYFDLNTLDADQVETKYYVLFEGDTPPVDPAPVGKTKITVRFADDDDAATIATSFLGELAALDLNASQSGAEVIYENSDIGKISIEDKSNAALFTFEILASGLGGDLGSTAEGGSTLNIETQSVELKADQTGQVVLGEIYTGSTASVEMSLIEMTKERWETIVGSVTGDVFEPTSGTRLVGQGTSRLYQNLFNLGGKLILHPIRLDKADRTEDITFWKSAPKPSSVSFSGQDIQGMEVTFTAYNDSSKPASVSLWAQGDYKQELV